MCRFAFVMMRLVKNRIVKFVALPLLTAQALVSCMVENGPIEANMITDKSVANYQVSGSVCDEEGTPIQGIRVIADYSENVVYQADTLYTDSKGGFSKFIPIPRVDRFYMTFSDIDGQANGGEFATKSEYVTPVRTEMSSGHFGGSYIVSVKVSLQKK